MSRVHQAVQGISRIDAERLAAAEDGGGVRHPHVQAVQGRILGSPAPPVVPAEASQEIVTHSRRRATPRDAHERDIVDDLPPHFGKF
ncbi:MAG: hypothetical protein SPI12_02525 [Actinomycetaceae bacterium]|nr:hypothetical protein [Actinomycetaceae bacterium]MDY6082724.1 hypothetical protein [Actinomycetaceae bacterium]